jgi:hypothetical protein
VSRTPTSAPRGLDRALFRRVVRRRERQVGCSLLRLWPQL